MIVVTLVIIITKWKSINLLKPDYLKLGKAIGSNYRIRRDGDPNIAAGCHLEEDVLPIDCR